MQTTGMIKKLLSICQSDAEEFRRSKQLDNFCQEFGLGQRVGSMWRIAPADKEKIATIVRNEAKVDPTASPAQWEGMTRHEALSKGGNEKHTKKRLRDDRVAVKTLSGRGCPGLCVNGVSTNPISTDLRTGY